MSWYNLFKLSASPLVTYNSLLLQEIDKSNFFVSKRFASYFANGVFAIFEAKDGNLYEVRVEGSKHAEGTKCTPESAKIANELMKTPLFAKSRKAGSCAIMVQFGKPEMNVPEIEYLVNVLSYKDSRHQNYFIDSKNIEATTPCWHCGKPKKNKYGLCSNCGRFGKSDNEDEIKDKELKERGL